MNGWMARSHASSVLFPAVSRVSLNAAELFPVAFTQRWMWVCPESHSACLSVCIIRVSVCVICLCHPSVPLYHLSVCLYPLSVLSVRLCPPSAWSSVCLSVTQLSVCLSRLSDHLSVCLFISSVCLIICLFVCIIRVSCLSLCLIIHLSVCLSVCHLLSCLAQERLKCA